MQMAALKFHVSTLLVTAAARDFSGVGWLGECRGVCMVVGCRSSLNYSVTLVDDIGEISL